MILAPRVLRGFVATMLALAADVASASMFAGETLDKVADIMAIVVLVIVPVVAIVVFWLVHVLPERFAEQRHHPQAKAIQVLCLLSLVFGGLLWPIAWLWAFTRPVLHQVAYGTDKGEEWHEEMGEKARAGELVAHEIDHLRQELDSMAARGALPPGLKQLRAELDALAAKPAPAGGNA
jgi:CBS domain containing-hemolysin-like protein